jgi:hypothetical protein
MAKTGSGQTIVVAGGGGSGGGGSRGGGGGGGNDGGSSGSKTKISGGKLKLDDQMFYTILGGAVGIFILVHVYQNNPGLFHGFIDPFRNLISGQPATPSVPAAPVGTTINDQIPQAPDPTAGQWGGGEMQYPQFPQQGTGQQPFQMPGQPQYPQQYQGMDPSGFGGGGAGGAGGQSDMMQTQWNPMFNQNSNVPMQTQQSFRASSGYDYSSKNGMIIAR